MLLYRNYAKTFKVTGHTKSMTGNLKLMNNEKNMSAQADKANRA